MGRLEEGLSHHGMSMRAAYTQPHAPGAPDPGGTRPGHCPLAWQPLGAVGRFRPGSALPASSRGLPPQLLCPRVGARPGSGGAGRGSVGPGLFLRP